MSEPTSKASSNGNEKGFRGQEEFSTDKEPIGTEFKSKSKICAKDPRASSK